MNEKPRVNEKPIEEAYDILQKIGDGHFAEVNLCVCRKSKKEFAAKFILKQRFNSPSTIGKEVKGTSPVDIDREAFILANLKHENIVKLHEVFHCDDAVVLILDLIPMARDHYTDVYICAQSCCCDEAASHIDKKFTGYQCPVPPLTQI